MKEMSKWL